MNKQNIPTSRLSAEVCVHNRQGLHARPAAVLAQAAQDFDSTIMLESNNQQADAKSILDILALAAPQGCGVVVKAEGKDASKALAAIKDLFKTRFGEEN